MSRTAADKHEPEASGATTVAEIMRDLEPMGDLSRFVIDDLTSDQEDEFFAILEDA